MISIQIIPALDSLAKKYKGIKFKEALQKEINTIALIIEGQSKRRTPVDTGRLRGSIFTTLGNLTATIMPNVNYSLYVHNGTRYQRARPFMLWGIQDSKSEISRVLGKEVKIAISKK